MNIKGNILCDFAAEIAKKWGTVDHSILLDEIVYELGRDCFGYNPEATYTDPNAEWICGEWWPSKFYGIVTAYGTYMPNGMILSPGGLVVRKAGELS